MEQATPPQQTKDQIILDFVKNTYIEIDDFFEKLEGLKDMADQDKFYWLSGMSARVSHLRNRLNRMTKDKDPRLERCRLDFIDPFLKEVDRQFKFHSRHFSVLESEKLMYK